MSEPSDSNEPHLEKIRRYQFPPLRKAWSMTENHNVQPLEAEAYQQQLATGFQQGMNDGFEQGVAQGYEEGVKQGREEGMRAGREEGKRVAHAEFTLAAQPIDNLVNQLTRALDEQEQRRRGELLQLVEKVTRQVIRCELALQPGQLLALIDEVLSGLPAAPKRLRVLLNPDEFARIRDIEPDKVSEWGLTADAEMEAGECRIVTESAEMDVGCGHRLEQCMDVLTQSLSAQQTQ